MKMSKQVSFVKRIWRALYGTLETRRRKKELTQKYHIHKKRRNIVIIGTPNHGNLGDYAIYMAEEELFRTYDPAANVFGIHMTDFQNEKQILKKVISPEDLLILTGGGNMGNQYMEDETVRRDTILEFPENRIVIFPQTLYFTEDEAGREEKEKSVQIYNGHKKLIIAARDSVSYEQMKALFHCPVFLLPDVVLTMKTPVKPDQRREGILLCLRSDCESRFCTQEKQWIRNEALKKRDKVSETDTVIPGHLKLDTLREKTLQKIGAFATAELVITDRLHGMIFAAVTNTPCLVFSNYNHKVRETYKWISHLDYIVFLENKEDMPSALEILLQKRECKFDGREIISEYAEFMKEIMHGQN